MGAHYSYIFSPNVRFSVTRSTKLTCSMLCTIDVVTDLSKFRIDDACNMIHAGSGASYVPTSAMSSRKSFRGLHRASIRGFASGTSSHSKVWQVRLVRRAPERPFFPSRARQLSLSLRLRLARAMSLSSPLSVSRAPSLSLPPSRARHLSLSLRLRLARLRIARAHACLIDIPGREQLAAH